MPITDNFDSYIDGDLNGQGSWSGNADFDVQGVTVQAGAKAIVNSASNKSILKSSTLASNGAQVIWGRVTTTGDDIWAIRLSEGGTDRIGVKTNGGNLQYFDGSTYNTIGTVSINTWFKLDVQWDFSTQMARYQLNDGGYTAYDTVLSNMSAGIDGVKLQNNGAAVTAYWDTLAVGQQTIVMDAVQGSYTLTGQDMVLARGKELLVTFGTFVITGISAALNLKAWVNDTKHSSTFSNDSKSSSSWANDSKS